MAQYERINWENSPSTETPLDADNLNKMDWGIDSLNRELAKSKGNISALETEIRSLETRFASLIRLEDGSTTGDAELQNGRIGYDGTEYEILGDAIRGQVGDINGRLDRIVGVPNVVRQAIYTILTKATYLEAGLEDEFSIVENWASASANAIVLSETSIILSGANTIVLSATLSPPDTTDEVYWSSSDTDVAVVSQQGLVTPISDGQCTIIAVAGSAIAMCFVETVNIPTRHAITNILTYCYNDNPIGVVIDGGYYTGTIFANDRCYLTDDDITVYMGNEDITETALSNAVISIAAVTDSVMIEAIAKQLIPFIDPDLSTWNYANSTRNGNQFTMNGKGVDSYASLVKGKPLYQYSAISDKTIRIVVDCTISGSTGGDGLVIIPATYSTNNPGNSSRKAYSRGVLATGNGQHTIEYIGVVSEILIYGTTPQANEYMGFGIYFRSNTGSTCVVNSITCDYIS